MRNHLTKHVLRQWYHCTLYNEARYCLVPPSSHCLFGGQPRRQNFLRTHNVQQRTLFNFFKRVKPITARLTPGYKTLIELEEKLTIRVRPPSAPEVYESLWTYVAAKLEQDPPVTLDDTEVRRLMIAFNHLKSEASKDTWQDHFTPDGIGQILQLLTKTAISADNKGPVSEFAAILYKESQRIAGGDSTDNQLRLDQRAYICIIASCGQALGARQLWLESWDGNHKVYRTCLNRIATGLIREGEDEELRKFISELEESGMHLHATLQRRIITDYANHRNDLEQAYYWYKYPLADNQVVDPNSRRKLLGLCMQQNNIDLGDELVKEMTQQDPDSKMDVDHSLQWALCKGKGPDAIARMIKIIQERLHDQPRLKPNMSTINVLAGLAISKFNDPYIAERYIEVGRELGLEPNEGTHLLQMKYKTEKKDFSGALASFDALRTFNPSEVDTEAINHLIVALCEHESQRNDSIMSLADYLTDRKAPLLPATVAALAKLHVYRHELDDLRNLIGTYAASFGSADRELVCVSLMDYVLDPEAATKEAWETWNIARNAFPEIPVPVRTQVMQAFFKRNRPDLGTHVFGQMRFSQIPELRPNLDTYVECIVGIGMFGDLRNLDTVHNMFKLDTEVEPCTKLLNAFMLSYARCSEGYTALRFWDTIIASSEGPTYSSIKIAFKACEVVPTGRNLAREIWKMVQSSEIEITREVYAAYVGAIAACTNFEEGAALCKNALRLGFEVDALLLGTFHNVSQERNKPRLKEWARTQFPDAYKQLLTCRHFDYTPPMGPEHDDGLTPPPETKTFFDVLHLGRELKP